MGIMVMFGRALLVASAMAIASATSAPTPATPAPPRAPLVTAADLQAAKDVAKKKEELCESESSGVDDLDARKEVLKEKSGDNFMLAVLKEANDDMEANDKDAATAVGDAMGEGDNGQTLGELTGLPFVLLVIFVVTFYLMCYTLCPCGCCGQCCRGCTQKKRNFSLVVKAGFLGVSLALVVVMLIFNGLAWQGVEPVGDGLKQFGCEAAKTSAIILNGTDANSATYFMGLLPMLDEINKIANMLDPGSPFLNGVNDNLDQTSDITDSMYLASQTIGLLKTAVNEISTVVAQQSHECVLCADMLTQLDPIQTTLNNGPGATLDAARKDVMDQLTGAAAADLKAQLDTAMEPLSNVKTSVVDGLASLVTSDDFDIKEQTDNAIMAQQGAVLAAGIVVILLAFCGVGAGTCWTFMEKKKYKTTGDEKFSCLPEACSCCSCVFGCWFIWFMLFLLGIFNIISVVLSSTCLTFADIDSQFLNDTGTLLNMNTSGDQFTMIGKMVDQCIRNPTGNTSFMDIIEMDDNGTMKTMRAAVVDQTVDTVNSQLEGANQIDDTEKIAEDPNFKMFKDILTQNKVSTWILLEESLWSTYNGLLTSTEQTLVQYQRYSLSCTEHTYAGVGDDLPANQKTVLPLMDFFNSAKTECGSNVDSATSTSCVGQAGQLTANGVTACNQAVTLLEMKRKLTVENVYKCPVFEKADGSTCDVSTEANVLDCLVNGEVKVKTVMCDLYGLETYMSQFAQRLENVFSQIDNIVPSTQTKIGTGMKTLVDKNVVDPMNSIVDGAQCNFIGVTYENLITVLCWQGTYGQVLIVENLLVMTYILALYTIVMYFLFRCAKDNTTADAKEAAEKKKADATRA
jgi:hypothetical protein